MCGKLDVTLRSFIMSWRTLHRDHVALDEGVPRARTSAVRACRTTVECVAFFRKHKASVKEFFFCSPGVALLLSTRLDSSAATVSRCTSALEFSFEWPRCQRFHIG